MGWGWGMHVWQIKLEPLEHNTHINTYIHPCVCMLVYVWMQTVHEGNNQLMKACFKTTCFLRGNCDWLYTFHFMGKCGNSDTWGGRSPETTVVIWEGEVWRWAPSKVTRYRVVIQKRLIFVQNKTEK